MLAGLIAAFALAQPAAEQHVGEAFQLTQFQKAEDVQEIASVMRMMSDIWVASTDTAKGRIVVRGRSSGVTVAQWLVAELDKPYQQPTPGILPAKHEYRIPNRQDGDFVLRVFHQTQPGPLRDLTGLTTLIGFTTEMRRNSVYTPHRAVVIGGTPSQIALAEWLFLELESRNAGQTRAASPQSTNSACRRRLMA